MFAVPFEQVAPLVGRSPAATRQLASRGRRRVQGGDAVVTDDPARQREVVRAFLAASRERRLRGSARPARPVRRAAGRREPWSCSAPPPRSRPALGRRHVHRPGPARANRPHRRLVRAPSGPPSATPQVVFDFMVDDGRIVEIDLLADPETLEVLELDG